MNEGNCQLRTANSVYTTSYILLIWDPWCHNEKNPQWSLFCCLITKLLHGCTMALSGLYFLAHQSACTCCMNLFAAVLFNNNKLSWKLFVEQNFELWCFVTAVNSAKLLHLLLLRQGYVSSHITLHLMHFFALRDFLSASTFLYHQFRFCLLHLFLHCNPLSFLLLSMLHAARLIAL